MPPVSRVRAPELPPPGQAVAPGGGCYDLEVKGLPVIETERLVLRPWRESDAEALLGLHGDPAFVRDGRARALSEPAEARALVRAFQDACRPPLGTWAATLRGGPLVGRGILDHPPDASGEPAPEVELGWELARAQRGQGLALEIGQALVEHGFETAELDAILLLVEPGHHRSAEVARRLGFADRGTTRAYYGTRLEHFLLERPRFAAAPPRWFRAGSRTTGSSPAGRRFQPRTRC